MQKLRMGRILSLMKPDTEKAALSYLSWEVIDDVIGGGGGEQPPSCSL